jgi:hypothetical protein
VGLAIAPVVEGGLATAGLDEAAAALDAGAALGAPEADPLGVGVVDGVVDGLGEGLGDVPVLEVGPADGDVTGPVVVLLVGVAPGDGEPLPGDRDGEPAVSKFTDCPRAGGSSCGPSTGWWPGAISATTTAATEPARTRPPPATVAFFGVILASSLRRRAASSGGSAARCAARLL